MPALQRSEEGDRETRQRVRDAGADPDNRPIEVITDDESDDGFGTPSRDGVDNATVRREQRELARDTKTGRFAKLGDEPQDEEFSYNVDEDEDGYGSEGDGDSRRRRRNRARRDAAARSNMVIGQLQHEVTQLRTLVGEMGRGQVSIAAGEIDNQLSTEFGRLDQIDSYIAAALKEQDFVSFQKAQRLRDEAKDRIAGLQFHKRRLEQQMAEPTAPAYPNQQQQQQQQNQPDPRALRLSETFMDRHPWFDPDSPDADSRMVVYIENELANEGSRPNTARHWKELERRVRERGLGKDWQEDGGDDMQEERRSRPTAGRSGGGRPAGTVTFRLDATMKEALDAEGLLDEKDLTEAQQKRREKLVRTWKSGMDAARKAGKL